MSIRNKFVTLTVIILVGVLSGCMSNPRYKDISDNNSEGTDLWGGVNFSINPHYSGMKIPCIAIMPFGLDESSNSSIRFHKPAPTPQEPALDLPGSEPESDTDTDSAELDPNDAVYPDELTAADKVDMLRRLFYAYMAPSGVKLIDLDLIDASLKGANLEEDMQAVGKAVQCDWLLKGRITDFSMHFLGVFANLSVGADVELIRASDGKQLWHGNHIARSQAGALPLTPMDLAMGTIKASSILNPDELESIASDLARRLVRTMPLEPNNNLVRTARINHFYRVAAHSLNMRSGPGTDYKVQKVLINSERVTLLDGSSNETWYHVRALDGTQGYVSRRYLKPLALGSVLMNQEDIR